MKGDKSAILLLDGYLILDENGKIHFMKRVNENSGKRKRQNEKERHDGVK